MKKIWLWLLGGMLVFGGLSYAATPTTAEIKAMSSKLETHKSKLLNQIEASKIKLKSIAQEWKNLSDTTLFKAASCLGAIGEESQTLDFTKLTDDLKSVILNEYIKLDGDIKRYEFWLNTADPVIFSNGIENFLNQNAIKITTLENEYYLKTNKTKATFLEYVNNNQSLLTDLAQKIETINLIDQHTNASKKAFSDFSNAVNSQSQIWMNMDATRGKLISSFESDLDQTIGQMLTLHRPAAAIEAKYQIHKHNFLNKFKTEINKSVYHVFSAFFDYTKYLDLLARQQEIHQKFMNTSGSINCDLLLTTTLNFAPYINRLEADSKLLINGMNQITTGIKNGKVSLKNLETLALDTFNITVNKLGTQLRNNFKLMLESETPLQAQTWSVAALSTESPTPASQNTSTSTTSTPTIAPTTVNEQLPITKTTFTQTFKKGQYHEQIKTLQTLLKNQGLYDGEIHGIHDRATIEAVYQFQLKYGIITGKEKNKSGYGWLGPKTRAQLNTLM